MPPTPSTLMMWYLDPNDCPTRSALPRAAAAGSLGGCTIVVSAATVGPIVVVPSPVALAVKALAKAGNPVVSAGGSSVATVLSAAVAPHAGHGPRKSVVESAQ
jgi:hypothetical protein